MNNNYTIPMGEKLMSNIDNELKSYIDSTQKDKTDEQLDAEFEALPEQMKNLVRQLGTEYGEEKREEMEGSVWDFYNKASRALKRKLKPQNKFSNQLLDRLKK